MNFVTAIHECFQRARRKLATVGLVVLACLFAAHVIFGANGMLAYRNKRTEYKKLKQELRSLEDENRRLSGRIKELKSDPKAIEREAREQLRYTRPGEVVYVLNEAAPVPPPNATAEKRP